MQLAPRSVIVPIAGLAGASSLIEVRADDIPPPSNDEGFDPQLAKLFGWGTLYQSGATAMSAVRRLRLGSVGVGRLRMLRGQPIPGYLSLQNAADIAGLDPANSRSAELGLALALIAYCGQSQATAIAATGQLETTARLGQAVDRSVKVEPVGRLAAKIAAVADNVEAQALGARTGRLCFYLPARTEDGAETLVAYAGELERLRRVCALQGGTLDVCPVETLNDAVVHLGIRGIQPTPADRMIATGLGVGALALIGWVAWASFVNAPMRLVFEDIVLADGNKVHSPLRATFEQERGAFVMSPACLGPQATPVYRSGEMLVLRAAVRNSGTWNGLLSGHQFIVVGVSERSGVKVLPPVAFAPPLHDVDAGVSLAGETLSVALPIEGPPERTKLVVLSKRGSPFDAAQVRKTIEEATAGKIENERINAATAALTRLAPGYIDYTFRSAEGDVSCAPL